MDNLSKHGQLRLFCAWPANVKRTIETLANQGVISFTQIEETSHQGAGARSVAPIGIESDL